MPRPSRSLRPRRAMIALSALLVAGIGLSGCAAQGETPSTGGGEPSATTEPSQPLAPAPEFIAGGSASENFDFFTDVLAKYASGTSPIEGQPIVDAVSGSGFDRSMMQVSFDRTKTNLVADYIFVSVRVDDSCLLGQLSTGDRSITTRIEPAIGPDGTICLIGETRPLDW